MKAANKRRKDFFKKKLEISCNEDKIQKTVQKSMEAYYMAEVDEALTKAEFLFQQSRYIHKRWWLVQGLLLFGLWLFLQYAKSDYYIQRCIGITAPVFVLLLMPEIWKNRSANAMEIEYAAYYSLRQIYAARMILFALADLVLLSLFFIGAFCIGGYSIGELIIQFFIPFNVTCCICFRTLYSYKAYSEAFALLLCIIWTTVWVQLAANEAIYDAISVPAWAAMLFLSFIYLGYCIRRGQRRCYEMWEV